MSNVIKEKAAKLKKFLNEKNYAVKHTECIEAISHIEYGTCYNVAKEQVVRILKPGEKLTVKEMKDTDFSIEVVIQIDLDTLMEGIDAVNNAASAMITGVDYALCDISYETYPYHYENGGVAIKVCGYIEEVESLESLEDYEEE